MKTVWRMILFMKIFGKLIWRLSGNLIYHVFFMETPNKPPNIFTMKFF